MVHLALFLLSHVDVAVITIGDAVVCAFIVTLPALSTVANSLLDVHVTVCGAKSSVATDAVRLTVCSFAALLFIVIVEGVTVTPVTVRLHRKRTEA